jgi:hypothetical protein
MFNSIKKVFKYIYEKISDRFNNLIVDHIHLLEENAYYCRMTDGNFSLKSDCEKDNQRNGILEKNRIIKERMENYKNK